MTIMKAAIVMTWTHPFPGREEKALAYAKEVNEFWGKQAAEGHCTPPEMYFSDVGIGLWIIQGDRDELLHIGDTEEARLLTLKGDLLLESFKVEIFYVGDSAVQYLEQFGKVLATI
jgi:hypothetical protein